MSLRSQIRKFGAMYDVYRQTATAGSRKQALRVATENVWIVPMSATAADINHMALVRAYTGYILPTANIVTGDYLRASSGDKYDVQGARSYNMGSQPLVELTLQRQALQGQI